MSANLFAKPWRGVSRERYRKLCLLIRLQRMAHRAPRPSVENGRAFERWVARIQQLEALARVMPAAPKTQTNGGSHEPAVAKAAQSGVVAPAEGRETEPLELQETAPVTGGSPAGAVESRGAQ